MQLARCQAFASASAFVRFGSLTTARLAEYDGTGRKSTPFFLLLHTYHTRDQRTPRILLQYLIKSLRDWPDRVSV